MHPYFALHVFVCYITAVLVNDMKVLCRVDYAYIR